MGNRDDPFNFCVKLILNTNPCWYLMELDPKILSQLDEQVVAYLSECDAEVTKFVNSLGAKEIAALNIAVSQLGSSFDISKSIGFLKAK